MLTAFGCSQPAPPLDNLTGVYEWRHEVFVFHGNEPEAVEVADEWLIESPGGDSTSLTMRGELTALDGRSCHVRGAIAKECQGYVARISATRGEDSLYCSATLLPSASGGLVLSATDDFCRRILCSGEGSPIAVVLHRVDP